MDELYIQRLIVLLETEPQSNKYNQIILDPKQFKEVSNTIMYQFEQIKDENIREGYEIVNLTLSEEEYSLPEEIKDIEE